MIRLSDTPLAEEFHPSLNSPFFAINFASKSGKKVWWLCEKGHEWEAAIYSRANGRGCPVCAGRKTETIATSHPKLIAEWHPTKNGNLLLDSFTSGSAKKVWWLCEKGHEWEAVINNRIKGSGCPFCSGRNAIKDVTSVMVTNPEIVPEWHPTKNIYNVDLSQFSAGKFTTCVVAMFSRP